MNRMCVAAVVAAPLAGACAVVPAGGSARDTSPPAVVVALRPAVMPMVGEVHERYQSYNVEMLEVTGGKFWRPYGTAIEALVRHPGETPAGMAAELYAYRPALDLGNPRLRALAAALGPAFVRVSGTWANTTYFAATDPAPVVPPQGFGGVLTKRQWAGVVDFAKAVDAEIVTSFAIGPGARDASGAWSPEQAGLLVDYTRDAGGRIAAAEFMNEPTLAGMGGAPPGYDAAAYGRDFRIFRDFARRAAPGMLILGPGSIGDSDEVSDAGPGTPGILRTRDLLAAAGRGVDAFSYHHYGTLSLRCSGTDVQAAVADALSERWLAATDRTLATYRRLRDDFEPGRRLWLTETADAACGGNPWARTFLDTFRYLDQLGRLARQQVAVVAHNTLVASDYGLLDDATLVPKPNYWGAFLWRRLMGAVVLDPGVPIQAGLHLYAHCLRGEPGGVALLAINNDRSAARAVSLPVPGRRFTLSSPSQDLLSATVLLNGRALVLGAGDALPAPAGAETPAGVQILAPATITFMALAGAANPYCGG